MFKRLPALIKFVFLVFMFMIISMLETRLEYVVFFVFTVLLLCLTRVNIFRYFKLMIFGFFLSFILFIFNYLFTFDLFNSLFIAVVGFTNFSLYFVYSIIFKVKTSNGEIAFIISYLFIGFSIFGYNQNKMYTTILIVLNNIYFMRIQIQMMYFHARLNSNPKGIVAKSKLCVSLINPFISNVLKQHHEMSLSLISKGYNPRRKKIRYYKV